MFYRIGTNVMKRRKTWRRMIVAISVGPSGAEGKASSELLINTLISQKGTES